MFAQLARLLDYPRRILAACHGLISVSAKARGIRFPQFAVHYSTLKATWNRSAPTRVLYPLDSSISGMLLSPPMGVHSGPAILPWGSCGAHNRK